MRPDVPPLTAPNGPDPLVGREFHGCRIEAEVGRGGMGVVYRAQQVALGRKVALKLVAPDLARDHAFRRRFERESRLAAAIDHPHAIPVYEAGDDGGVLFILMRYVAGADLASVLAFEGALEPARVARIVAQVGSALDAAHATGLVHRDVKPANILLAGEGANEHAYLSDFGLTKDASSTSALTHTGQWVGTLDYVAPEQLEGKPVDARTDVYALGCLLYEALSGAVPYQGSDMAKMWGHANNPPPSLAELDAGRAAFGPVVARALAKAPGERFPSSGDLGRAAAAAAEGRTPPAEEHSVATGAAAPGVGILEKPLSGASTRTSAPGRLPPARPAASSGQLQADRAIGTAPVRKPGSGRRIAAVATAAILMILTAGAVFLGAWLARQDPSVRADATPQAPSEASAPSSAAETVTIPLVLGGSASTARAKLKQSGFDVTVVKRFSDMPVGQVVNQRPAPRARVPPRTSITLFVSKGPEQRPLTVDTPLTTSGLGAVTVGMTVKQAEKATGNKLVPAGGEGAAESTGSTGCTYVKVKDLPGVSMMVSDTKIVRIDVTKPGIATLSGVKVGSSLHMVERAYGDKVKKTADDQAGPTLTFVPEDPSDRTRIVFLMSRALQTKGLGESEEVASMAAGQLPEVAFTEGCS